MLVLVPVLLLPLEGEGRAGHDETYAVIWQLGQKLSRVAYIGLAHLGGIRGAGKLEPVFHLLLIVCRLKSIIGSQFTCDG